jgi:hypothetical protein
MKTHRKLSQRKKMQVAKEKKNKNTWKERKRTWIFCSRTEEGLLSICNKQ